MRFGANRIGLAAVAALVLGLAACEDPAVVSVAKARLAVGGATGSALNELKSECRRRVERAREQAIDSVKRRRELGKAPGIPFPVWGSPEEACRCFVESLAVDMSDLDLHLLHEGLLLEQKGGKKALQDKKFDLFGYIKQLEVRQPMPGPQVQMTQSQLHDYLRKTRDRYSALQSKCKTTG